MTDQPMLSVDPEDRAPLCLIACLPHEHRRLLMVVVGQVLETPALQLSAAARRLLTTRLTAEQQAVVEDMVVRFEAAERRGGAE